MEDSTSPTFGMNRRELLKRGAVVGGTLMWAAPTVQTVGMRAAFGQTAGGTPQDADLISCVTIKFTDGVNCYYAKWEDASDGSGGGGWVDPGSGCPDCADIALGGCTAVNGALFFDDPTVCAPTSTNDDCLEFCLLEPTVYDITAVQTKNGAKADCQVQTGLSVDCVKAQVDNTSNN